MKTLYKTYNPTQARMRQIILEKQTGVKWDYYHIGDGFKFTPIVTKDTETNIGLANKLFPFLTYDGCGFLKLSEASGMSLQDVLIAAKTLVKDCDAIGGVNRMGNFASIRLKR